MFFKTTPHTYRQMHVPVCVYTHAHTYKDKPAWRDSHWLHLGQLEHQMLVTDYNPLKKNRKLRVYTDINQESDEKQDFSFKIPLHKIHINYKRGKNNFMVEQNAWQTPFLSNHRRPHFCLIIKVNIINSGTNQHMRIIGHSENTTSTLYFC